MLRDTYLTLRDILSQAEIEAPESEARLLIESVTGLNKASQIANSDLIIENKQEQKLLRMAKKRAQHVPLQYILGSWSFMGIELSVGEGVLIPRDDTEVLVNLCLDYLKDIKYPSVIDLCAGSGAIGLALDKYANAKVLAVELSEKALKYLTKNVLDTNVKIYPCDVLTYKNNSQNRVIDLIVSNPPYIKTEEIKNLQPEVGYEPEMALDGGKDGLVFYREIVKRWTHQLKKGGALAFELGEGQAEYVRRLMEQNGFVNIKTALDLGGAERAIIGILP